MQNMKNKRYPISKPYFNKKNVLFQTKQRTRKNARFACRYATYQTPF
jgi:hypothetical protein